MHAPRFFAHGDHTLSSQVGRCEVNVRELGERIANGVVDRALADLAAFNMRNGNAQGEGYGCRGEHLISIGDEQ